MLLPCIIIIWKFAIVGNRSFGLDVQSCPFFLSMLVPSFSQYLLSFFVGSQLHEWRCEFMMYYSTIIIRDFLSSSIFYLILKIFLASLRCFLIVCSCWCIRWIHSFHINIFKFISLFRCVVFSFIYFNLFYIAFA